VKSLSDLFGCLVNYSILLGRPVAITGYASLMLVFRIKFPTKYIFKIFLILKINRMMPSWNLYLWDDPRINLKTEDR